MRSEDFFPGNIVIMHEEEEKNSGFYWIYLPVNV